ncbi:hypothetical protein QBC37DRAFT_191895 [Rhypophila decipiens]|uniref:Uncharacterized protein n=1 Tax=Rhypophila decipiens TaxID=261697 RepID=A0AAN6YAL9_9PEZI|nr:hypothetical protein QBC37DRAFT_191895 [Rhypophila decipiens]
MLSQVATRHLISSRTSIPLPWVYDYNTTKDNLLYTPYLCISFIPGRKILEVWIDTLLSICLEDYCLRILTIVAQSIAQLETLNCPKIGSPYRDDQGVLAVGKSSRVSRYSRHLLLHYKAYTSLVICVILISPGVFLQSLLRVEEKFIVSRQGTLYTLFFIIIRIQRLRQLMVLVT